ncbi:phage tail assembly protein [Methylocystis heyeri]|uniref:Phage tail assembly protein n=1 Tax=Methylocystis heyeri TaxID=391905 RepID=A0A6B8KJI9_9HYPH|nr:phage tail assembly protein [Methylocystis heyeri]QGM46750.1 hypothetical protein H2LOC_014185 [Methylocystis heyeri]
MTDAPAAAAPIPAIAPIVVVPADPQAPAGGAPDAGAAGPAVVDFDAGQNWQSEVYPLKHPFKFAGVTYTSVTIRTPSGADIANYVSGKATPLDFAIQLTGLDSTILLKLHAADYKAITKAALGFLA